MKSLYFLWNFGYNMEVEIIKERWIYHVKSNCYNHYGKRRCDEG